MTPPVNLVNYAIFAEQTLQEETVEMKFGMPNRYFNQIEAGENCPFIKRDPQNFERIILQPGTYRISGVSFITMIPPGPLDKPIPLIDTRGLLNIYPGYCVLYDATKPAPTPQNLSNSICLGTMATAYDSAPSTYDCVYSVGEKGGAISLGHQCGYPEIPPADHKAYLRVGGTKYHVAARIVIFKIA
jgi:hypothetical protein